MKTTKLLLAIACGSALVFGACKKETDTASSDKAVYGSYKITGKVWYDQNTSVTFPGPEPMNNASIIAEINSYDLLDNPPTGTSPKMYYSTASNGGAYLLTIDVGNKAVPITVYPQDFDGDQTNGTTTLRKIWTSASFNVSGIKGGSRVRDITYL